MSERPAGVHQLEPFFASPAAASMRRRLLLVTHHFPPGTAVGALRWEKLAALATAAGWAVDVVTAHPSCVERPDPARLQALPPGIRLYGVCDRVLLRQRALRAGVRTIRRWQASLRAARRPAAAGSAVGAGAAGGAAGGAPPTPVDEALHRDEILRGGGGRRALLRRYFAWTYFREQALWARDVAAVGTALARAGRYDAVATSGPPHMAHEAGRRIADAAGLPLVVDLRDPWSLVERVPEWVASPLWFTLSARYERRVVAASRLVLLNTEPSRRAMAALYPEAAARMLTVMNGADDEPLPPPRRGHRFVVGFAGSIYLDRDPRLLFRAAARLVAELSLQPADFGIDLIGNVESYGGVPVSEMARQEGVGDYVTTGPARPRAQALDFLAGAAMLVSLPQDSDMAIPAKVFEYTQFEAWLLVFARRDSATELLLRGSDADVVDPQDVAGTTAVLRRRYEAYRRGERPCAVGRDGRFLRRTQAAALFEALDGVVKD